MKKYNYCGLCLLGLLAWLTAAPSEMEIKVYYDSIRALASDHTVTGRTNSTPLIQNEWKKIPGVINYHGNPKVVQDGVVLENFDLTGKTLFMNDGIKNLTVRQCSWDQSEQEKPGGPSFWIALGKSCDNIIIENNNFIGRKGADNINGGIIPMRAGNDSRPIVIIQRNRFKWTSGDYIKHNFGPGSIIRYNHFGYPRLFDADISYWKPDVSYKAGDRILYKNALSVAIKDNIQSRPSASNRDGDTEDWKNLGDKPHFDYIQGATGGPVKYYGNCFEVGADDRPGMRQVNQILRWVREHGNYGGDIRGIEFVGNVCTMQKDTNPPLFPYAITDQGHPQNVTGPWIIAYNILIKPGKTLWVGNEQSSIENTHWYGNFYDGTMSPIPPPREDMHTTPTVELPPPAL